jgi:hypothetical protein
MDRDGFPPSPRSIELRNLSFPSNAPPTAKAPMDAKMCPNPDPRNSARTPIRPFPRIFSLLCFGCFEILLVGTPGFEGHGFRPFPEQKHNVCPHVCANHPRRASRECDSLDSRLGFLDDPFTFAGRRNPPDGLRRAMSSASEVAARITGSAPHAAREPPPPSSNGRAASRKSSADGS